MFVLFARTQRAHPYLSLPSHRTMSNAYTQLYLVYKASLLPGINMHTALLAHPVGLRAKLWRARAGTEVPFHNALHSRAVTVARFTGRCAYLRRLPRPPFQLFLRNPERGLRNRLYRRCGGGGGGGGGGDLHGDRGGGVLGGTRGRSHRHCPFPGLRRDERRLQRRVSERGHEVAKGRCGPLHRVPKVDVLGAYVLRRLGGAAQVRPELGHGGEDGLSDVHHLRSGRLVVPRSVVELHLPRAVLRNPDLHVAGGRGGLPRKQGTVVKLVKHLRVTRVEREERSQPRYVRHKCTSIVHSTGVILVGIHLSHVSDVL